MLTAKERPSDSGHWLLYNAIILSNAQAQHATNQRLDWSSMQQIDGSWKLWKEINK